MSNASPANVRSAVQPADESTTAGIPGRAQARRQPVAAAEGLCYYRVGRAAWGSAGCGWRNKRGISMATWIGAMSPALVDGAYRTVPRRTALFARLFPTLRFYPWFTYLVCKGSSSAARGRYRDEDWSRNSFEVLQALEGVGVRFEITGTGHFSGLPGPCVFVGNHMSTLEAFVLPSIIQPLKRVAFVVKRSLVEYPVFGHLMRARAPVVVGRVNPRDDLKAVFEGGLERLQAGISIVVFPQRTRSPLFDPTAFNSIGIKLAKRAQVPVVPLALKTDAWANGSLLKDFGRIDPAKTVHFAFGEPLPVQGAGAAEHQRVVGFIRENLEAWGGKVAHGVAAEA
jgi:1-acyl-sn-glycerol-3-phosphate acyltransferase